MLQLLSMKTGVESQRYIYDPVIFCTHTGNLYCYYLGGGEKNSKPGLHHQYKTIRL